MLPGVVVEGVGAVGLPVPPVGTVYHSRLDPFAVNGTAVAFWQYVTGVVTPGAAGKAITITVMEARGPSQLFTVWLT